MIFRNKICIDKILFELILQININLISFELIFFFFFFFFCFFFFNYFLVCFFNFFLFFFFFSLFFLVLTDQLLMVTFPELLLGILFLQAPFTGYLPFFFESHHLLCLSFFSSM